MGPSVDERRTWGVKNSDRQTPVVLCRYPRGGRQMDRATQVPPCKWGHSVDKHLTSGLCNKNPTLPPTPVSPHSPSSLRLSSLPPFIPLGHCFENVMAITSVHLYLTLLSKSHRAIVCVVQQENLEPQGTARRGFHWLVPRDGVWLYHTPVAYQAEHVQHGLKTYCNGPGSIPARAVSCMSSPHTLPFCFCLLWTVTIQSSRKMWDVFLTFSSSTISMVTVPSYHI